MTLRNNDLFAALNGGLFALLAGTVYLQRFERYRGPGNLDEFFIYGCAIAALIGIAWIFLRRVDYPAWLLALAQVGLLAHFAGAFVPVASARLYDTVWLGLGYDKYVHGFNAFVGVALLVHLFDRLEVRLAFRWLVILMIVLGAGAVLEVMEYLVSLAVPQAGVGDYDNNMRDLIANAAGALASTFAAWALPRLRQRRARPLAA